MQSRIEPKADRQTWMVIAVYLLFSVVVISTSRQMESAGNLAADSASAIWLAELTSHFMVIIAALIVPYWLSKFPLSSENWVRRIPVYVLCFVIYALVHIIGMMLLRKGLFPILLGSVYDADLMSWQRWAYELRKDFMSFALVLSAFLITRQMFQLRLEAEAAHEEARSSGRITLKSGGRMLFLNADEILYAKAAGNYIEVHTDGGMHLVRMTMSALEKLLAEAGQHLRVHRSYMVQAGAISEMRPNGEGEAIVSVPNKVQIPVSRKFRSAVEAALSQAASR